MRILDLCSGKGSSSRAFLDLGHEVFTIDILPEFEPSLIADITTLDFTTIPGSFDIVIFAPPCEKMSIASNNKGHWVKDSNTGIISPISPEAKKAIEIVSSGLGIIKYQMNKNPNLIYFIENPRGKMRHTEIMKGYNRDSVCYCQYGDLRMKPTDIWHNSKTWFPRSMCKNGRDPGSIKEVDGIEWVFYNNKMCHQRAQRPVNCKDKKQSNGTFGLKTYAERSLWPYQLSYEIASASQKEMRLRNGN